MKFTPAEEAVMVRMPFKLGPGPVVPFHIQEKICAEMTQRARSFKEKKEHEADCIKAKMEFRKREIEDLYSKGLCDQEIAYAMKLPKRLVAISRRELGLPAIHKKLVMTPRRMHQDEIARRLKNGHTVLSIAKDLGVSRSTVGVVKKDLGLTKPRKK